MLISLILISIEKPRIKIKKTNAHLNFDLKWVNVTLLLYFFENHPNKLCKKKKKKETVHNSNQTAQAEVQSDLNKNLQI